VQYTVWLLVLTMENDGTIGDLRLLLEILEIYDECRCNWKSLAAFRERETIYML